MNDRNTVIESLKEAVREFARERDWGTFHSPKNLAMGLAIESAELMEHCLWKTPEESEKPDDAEAVAGELADVLGASPGSISTMTRMLIQCGLVERVAVPGQRTAAFQMKTGAAREIMAGWQIKTTKMRDLLRHGLNLLDGQSDGRRQRILEQLEFHEFIERALPELLAGWDRRAQEEEGKTDD